MEKCDALCWHAKGVWLVRDLECWSRAEGKKEFCLGCVFATKIPIPSNRATEIRTYRTYAPVRLHLRVFLNLPIPKCATEQLSTGKNEVFLRKLGK